ncbi:hypothetical protein [Shimazuella alba]|uniref:Uncharacterized protein n=1 Tax=Shimazuella alba TaxID=2690964 RepID=A0A6I4VKY3_9BACL|nr:hypothetical protein [Shimazuella alba]MXQ52239.1 hypothetical protein [Shimazuella alba]
MISAIAEFEQEKTSRWNLLREEGGNKGCWKQKNNICDTTNRSGTLTIKLLHAEKTQLEETAMEIKGANCDIFAPPNKANERRIFLISERALLLV